MRKRAEGIEPGHQSVLGHLANELRSGYCSGTPGGEFGGLKGCRQPTHAPNLRPTHTLPPPPPPPGSYTIAWLAQTAVVRRKAATLRDTWWSVPYTPR